MVGMRWLIVAAATLIVAAATLGSGTAEAQVPWITPAEDGFAERERRDPPLSVGGALELTLWGGGAQVFLADVDATSFTGTISAALVYDGMLEVGSAIGFTWGEARQAVTTDDDGAAATNPWIYGAYVHDIERLARIRGGLGVAFPLDPRGVEDALATTYAVYTFGGANAWLWAADRFSLVPFVSIEAVPIQYLYLAASLHLGILIPTSDTGETDVDFQFEGAAGVRYGILLAALRFRVVWVPTSEAADLAQVSMEPFVRLVFDAGPVKPFAELRLTMNLDEPAGFSFDQYKVWGMHLMGGVDW